MLAAASVVAIAMTRGFRGEGAIERPHRAAPGKAPASAPAAPATSPQGAIEVYFSHTYENDPAAARSDTDNIDRHLAAFIAGADRSLDCAFFELGSDRIAAALIAARRRGVQVRIVADADYRDDAPMRRVIADGIPVVFDERHAFMHNKFVAADGRAVWTGSFNATDNCSFRNNNNAVAIRSSEVAANYAAEFAEMFVKHSFGVRSPSATPHSLVKLPDADVYTWFAPEDGVPPKVIRVLRSAQRSIHFMAFSFTDTAIGGTMIAMHRKGVTVEGVVETRNAGGAGGQMQRLSAAGVTVLPDGNTYVMHHKVIVVDGLWTITGSYNFTASGANENDENVLIIKSAAVARQFEREYDRVKRMARAARGAA